MNASLEDVLVTERLAQRSSRNPDYERQWRAVSTLGESLANTPATVLQTVVETALRFWPGTSVGISLLEPAPKDDVFRWVAVAGPFAPNVNGTLPKAASPCGKVIADNAMIVAFSADFRKLELAHPLGILDLTDYVDWLDVVVPIDRLVSISFALLLVLGLYLLLRRTNLGRAIVAVRMDARAAALMGIDINQIFAVTFGLGAAMAGAAGALFSLIFPISSLTSPAFLGKAFVICVLGGLGSVPGVLVGGIALGIIESFGALLFGAEYSLTLAFSLLILLLIFRPTGLIGSKAFQ